MTNDKKKRGNSFIGNLSFELCHSRSGQSLIEIIVGLAIGSILIGAAAFAISAMLQANLTNQKGQAALAFSQELLNKAKAYGSADWQHLYGLEKSSSTQYYLNATGTSYFVIEGKEGVIDNDVTSGLVGHWKFDEDSGSTSTITYDATANGNNGTLVGSPTRTTSTCKIANCLQVNGTSQYVSLASSLNPTSYVTVTAWFKRVGVPTSGYHIIFMQGTQIEISIPESTGQIRTGVTTATLGRQVFNSGTGLLDGNWHHLALTYNGSALVSYIDGAQTATNSVTGTITTGSPTNIGNYGGYYANGYIDDVRIYNRALSANEVKQLYSSNIFKRFFYVENACRTNDASSSISGVDPCGMGSSDDPSTQKVTSVVQWTTSAGAGQAMLSDFVTRWKNAIFQQTDWSGGVGGGSPITSPGNTFSSSSGADFTDGSFRIQGL